MAYTPTRLYGGILGTGTTTLYTVPAGKTVIVKQVVFANSTAAAVTASISVSGVASLTSSVSIPANGTTTLDLSQVLNAGEILAGSAGSGSAINCLISGVVFP